MTVNSLRNSRRGGADLPQMADVAATAILEHSDGFGFVTGQLMSVELATGAATMVNAGHPLPLLDRAGEVQQLDLHADVPFGIQLDGYRLQHFAFQPGDRLLFVTDGMLESNAAGVDLPSLLAALRGEHPRQVVHSLTDHVLDASRSDLRDDATVLCLDWSGPRSTERDSSAGADVGEHPAAP